MEMEWRSGWIFRIACWLALWAFGLASAGLLLFGIVAAMQAMLGVGPVLAIVAGGLGMVLWFVLCRKTAPLPDPVG